MFFLLITPYTDSIEALSPAIEHSARETGLQGFREPMRRTTIFGARPRLLPGHTQNLSPPPARLQRVSACNVRRRSDC